MRTARLVAVHNERVAADPHGDARRPAPRRGSTCVGPDAPNGREPRALPKWLMQVAHHKCYHWKRQQQRVVSRDAEPNLPEPEAPAVAENLVRQTQEEQMLREAIAALAPRCRQMIEMLFFEAPARPYRQVAAELGLAVGSIGFTRQKCIERLRRLLEEMGFQ